MARVSLVTVCFFRRVFSVRALSTYRSHRPPSNKRSVRTPAQALVVILRLCVFAVENRLNGTATVID